MTLIQRIVLILLLICGAPPTAAWAATSTTEVPVRVGVLLPLTGEFAAWSEGIRRSIELVAEAKGARFVFEFEDEGNCEAQKAVAGFKKLIWGGSHFIMVGCLAGTKAILPIAKEEQVLLLSAGLVDDSAFHQSTQLINLATQISTESRYLAARVLSRGFKRVATIHWEDPFSNEFAETLARELAARGLRTLAREAVDPKEVDYRPVLLRIKKFNPDAICFNVGQDQQGILLRQAQGLGIEVPFFSVYGFETPSILDLGSVLANVEYSFPMNSAEASPEKIDFDRRFQERFGAGARPTSNSYFVQDGLILLNQAIRHCTAPDPACVGKFFKNTRHYSGLSGDISFRSDGSNDRPYGIKKVENHRFVWVVRDADRFQPIKKFGEL